jgi:hypothetical protein
VSSGPKPYNGTTLPDQVIIDELTQHGQVFRTDLDDAACKTNPAKIGPDNDGQPGGCDNVRVLITGNAAPQVGYWRMAD